jgi:hypothetical protein
MWPPPLPMVPVRRQSLTSEYEDEQTGSQPERRSSLNNLSPSGEKRRGSLIIRYAPIVCQTSVVPIQKKIGVTSTLF